MVDLLGAEVDLEGVLVVVAAMVVLLVVDMEVAKVEVMVVDNVVGMEGDKMVGTEVDKEVGMEVDKVVGMEVDKAVVMEVDKVVVMVVDKVVVMVHHHQLGAKEDMVNKVVDMVVPSLVVMEVNRVDMGNSLKVAMEVPLQLQVAVMEVPLQQEQTIPRHPLVAMEVLVNMVNLLTDNQLVPHMVELDLTIVQQDMLPLQHLPMAQQAQRHLPVTLLVVVVVVDMVHQVMVLVDMEEVCDESNDFHF